MSDTPENDAAYPLHAAYLLEGREVGYFYDCPRCHFWKNASIGPCRRTDCDGTVERVEFRVFPPGTGDSDA